MNLKKALIVPLLLIVSLPGISLANEIYVVQSGDSLWKIAVKTKAPDVTVLQMIAAIHEQNSAALGADIANIKPGMKLSIPTNTVASNANSQYAEQLLGGSPSSGSTLTRNDRIDMIQKQISRIEKDIDQTIDAMKASLQALGEMITQ